MESGHCTLFAYIVSRILFSKLRKCGTKHLLFKASLTVSIVYRNDLPRWLAVGLHLLALQRSGDAAAWEEAMRTQADSPQTLKRFMRVAAFLEQHYLGAIEPGQDFRAGSAVMLEFMQLHEVSTKAAHLAAAGVFSGETSVRELRRLLTTLRESTTSPVVSHHAQRYADFSQQAIELFLKKPELLNLGPNVMLKVTQTRSTLMPKLVAQTPEGEVAIDIRAPDVNAARTAAAAAAALASRIAVLRLRFYKVVVVLPLKSARYADETLKLLREWTREPDEILPSVYIGLLSSQESLEIKQG